MDTRRLAVRSTIEPRRPGASELRRREEVFLAGAGGIAVDALGSELLALAAFQGLVDADEESTGGGQVSNEQSEQEARGLMARPASAVEDAMSVLEVLAGLATVRAKVL